MELGHTLEETVLKKGLRELNSDLHFDMGANLNLPHPMMNIRQGVFYKGRHITGMDRGAIPEFAVWSLRPTYCPETKTIVKRPAEILRIGWRETCERIIRARIPGVTHESIAAKFGVPIKRKRFQDQMAYDNDRKETRLVTELH